MEKATSYILYCYKATTTTTTTRYKIAAIKLPSRGGKCVTYLRGARESRRNERNLVYTAFISIKYSSYDDDDDSLAHQLPRFLRSATAELSGHPFVIPISTREARARYTLLHFSRSSSGFALFFFFFFSGNELENTFASIAAC